MFWLQETLTAIRDFMELGGGVLTIIAVLTFFIWLLALERWVFLTVGIKKEIREVIKAWEERPDHMSWKARQLRHAMIAEVTWDAKAGLNLLKTLVALCPLLGLMGTVTGMIEVFDVMAAVGSGSARSMASGVSKATIPTMAGMVAALSGVFATTILERKSNAAAHLVEDQLMTR